MTERPKISIYIAASIDGYIARKDNSLEWLDRVGGFDEDYGFKKLLDSIDTLIIGRKTYDIAATLPDPYPGKKVVVLSNTLKSVRERVNNSRLKGGSFQLTNVADSGRFTGGPT